jgi:hypothetical protein
MHRAALVCCLLPSLLAGAEPGASVTVYSSADPAGFDPQAALRQERSGYEEQEVPGFAVVRELRQLELKAGVNTVDLTDVAKRIDPATVSLVDSVDPQAVRVIEQRFLFDLVSPAKLLDRYLDRKVGVFLSENADDAKWTDCVLLANDGNNLVLQTETGLRLGYSVNHDIRLGKLPEGLITRPTLRWQVDAAAAGRRTVRTAYQTGGLTWRADYTLALDATGRTATLGSWVTLLNQSGGAWPQAKLKLVAGDVQQVDPNRHRGGFNLFAGDAAKDGGFSEKAFFEYHFYTLARPTDILDRSTQQIALFPTVAGVAVEKVLIFAGQLPDGWQPPEDALTDAGWSQRMQHHVDVFLRFANTKANHLGMPLPRGKLRLYQEDAADHAQEFIGEDLIDHTPADEALTVRSGRAFDVVGSRTQTAFKHDSDARTMSESFRVELRNRKAEAATVQVREGFWRWSNWEVTAKSADFAKLDARTIQFTVELPPGATKTVEYTVKYSW